MENNPYFRALFEFDLEIERTFGKLQRQKAFQKEQTISTVVGEEMVKDKLFGIMPPQSS